MSTDSIVSPSGEEFEILGRAGPVERQSAPAIAAEAREELLVIKDGEVFLCARPDGDIAPARASGEGLYAYDTRHLSELRFEVGGSHPVVLSSAAVEDHAVVDATNATLRQGPRLLLPQQSLSISRDLMVSSGRLYFAAAVRSFLAQPLTVSLSISLAADFADIFEVRGGPRRASRGQTLAPKRTDKGLVLAYIGEDRVFRASIVEFDQQPQQLEIVADRALLSWEVNLDRERQGMLAITVEPSVGGQRRRRRRAQRARAELQRSTTQWIAECTAIESDNRLFGRLLSTSITDLRALIVPAAGGHIVSAGIPWYVAPFGRDALITSIESLLLGPRLLRDALTVLARLQASFDDPWRDAEPGKIMHELRVGELAGAGIVPHTPYYGTVDATPLFLIAAAEYWAWTGDLETLRGLRPSLEAALRWIDEFGDIDRDGFVEYSCRSPGGLQNQGWKDSETAIVDADGRLAEGPIALVEVQGYVFAAKQKIAAVFRALGEAETAERLRREAQELAARFEEAFWDPQEGTYALALDGAKRQVRSVTSNPGHCLYCGIVQPRRAAAVAQRLMADDMFSGWGVRTLSRSNPAYNPMSYHNGSVWPHDNALIAAGLKRYGHDDAARRVADALFDVAVGSRDFRLPELYCGFDRSQRPALVSYPVACIPQAWASAAPLLILQTMLGIGADAASESLTITRPELPQWLSQVRLTNLKVGQASVTLDFQRVASTTSFALLEQSGGSLSVTMAAGR